MSYNHKIALKVPLFRIGNSFTISVFTEINYIPISVRKAGKRSYFWCIFYVLYCERHLQALRWQVEAKKSVVMICVYASILQQERLAHLKISSFKVPKKTVLRSKRAPLIQLLQLRVAPNQAVQEILRRIPRERVRCVARNSPHRISWKPMLCQFIRSIQRDCNGCSLLSTAAIGSIIRKKVITFAHYFIIDNYLVEIFNFVTWSKRSIFFLCVSKNINKLSNLL